MAEKPESKKFSLPLLSKIKLNRGMLNLIFITALVLISTISILSYKQLQDLLTANRWVDHTYDVIQTIDACLYDIIDIESRQRGYLIRGTEKFINDIDILKTNLKLGLNELATLTKNNPEQNKRVLRFIDLVEERLAILNEVMQLKPNNKLSTPEGYEILDQSHDISNRVKNLGQEIKSVELVLLSERNVAAVTGASTISRILIVGSIVSIVSLIIAFLLANIELFNRRNMEKYYHNMQIRLKQIIESTSDMIAAFDKDNKLIIFNEAYQKEFKSLFDRNLDIDMPVEELLKDVDDNKKLIARKWIQSLKDNITTHTIELHSEGINKFYETTTNLIKNNSNEIIGIVHSVRNITKRIQEHTNLQSSYKKLAESMKELEEKNKQITLLVEMSDIMLASSSQEELSHVMSKFSERLLNFANGYIYIMHPSKNYLEKATSWGRPHEQEQIFTPEQCWGIRLGRIHYIDDKQNALVCSHINTKEIDDCSFICLPLMAQNDIYGLLYLQIHHDKNSPILDENQRLLLIAFGELTALALANVRLRENLKHQSIRDPLTGLYNRRYFEDFIFKQLHQAERSKSSFAILMLDLDHFKKINDTFGHDAGDAVLKDVGQVLNEAVRLGDVTSRYGGEEFIILFNNIDEQMAKKRANHLRTDIAKIQISYGAQQIGPIAVSIGIAMYPSDGKTTTEVVEAADKALYYAKNSGRNRVVLYGESNNEKDI